ncbi:hypothetical protein BAY61_15745 [Prauserella marina]|uniref:DNA-binding transcriptional regulator, AcrR family n=1 Tax=Prauserella marina TaxID=530584 RepID=A0A222VQN3_9PSEU|nr:TetR/AcrR family transcriptional regulator [Prauserella marina]ASR36218.1 hypothetical protein BAY61_15745 [Prauserella marina]PWV76977.1 TetR family transcriptional regulator [Prauserella marina]SDD01542.1 DNA-binding transcriptional regulator, AcrR family [Prauserella marina]
MSTRDRILDVAATVIEQHGLARATTKQIATTAGYSEATLYKHFSSKTELFTRVLAERAPGDLAGALRALPDTGRREGLPEALRTVAVAALSFYRHGFPMAGSLFAEPDLLAAHRADLTTRGEGPEQPIATLASYLAACRDRGEIAPGTNVEAAARMLLGACFQQAFLSHLNQPGHAESPPATFAAILVTTLIDGIE